MDTLFGHLVTRFGSAQAENMATEGLSYVLKRSAEARRLVLQFLTQSGASLPADLNFSTQVAGEGGSIPDMIGRDAAGAEVLILEAKFWAGLTERQPKAYLARLPVSGLLVFVAPSQRFESLWPELLRRGRDGGFRIEEGQVDRTVMRVANVGDDRRLALTSWRAILGTLHNGLQQAGETQLAADVLQLIGLADRMDGEAFLPLASEELTGATGRRIIQFCRLVDDAVERLKAMDMADTTNLRPAGDRFGSYSSFFRVGPFGCRLYFDPRGWSERGIPLTLQVQGIDWKGSLGVNSRLLPLAEKVGTTPIFNDYGTYLPILLPIGVERELVLDAVVEQILPVVRIALAKNEVF